MIKNYFITIITHAITRIRPQKVLNNKIVTLHLIILPTHKNPHKQSQQHNPRPQPIQLPNTPITIRTNQKNSHPPFQLLLYLSMDTLFHNLFHTIKLFQHQLLILFQSLTLNSNKLLFQILHSTTNSTFDLLINKTH